MPEIFLALQGARPQSSTGTVDAKTKALRAMLLDKIQARYPGSTRAGKIRLCTWMWLKSCYHPPYHHKPPFYLTKAHSLPCAAAVRTLFRHLAPDASSTPSVDSLGIQTEDFEKAVQVSTQKAASAQQFQNKHA